MPAVGPVHQALQAGLPLNISKFGMSDHEKIVGNSHMQHLWTHVHIPVTIFRLRFSPSTSVVVEMVDVISIDGIWKILSFIM